MNTLGVIIGTPQYIQIKGDKRLYDPAKLFNDQRYRQQLEKLDWEIMYAAIDHEEFSFYALYWDRIEWPHMEGSDASYMVPLPIGPDGDLMDKEDFHAHQQWIDDLPTLEAENILHRTTYSTGQHLDVRIEAFREKNASDPGGGWAVAQQGEDLVLPPAYAQEARVARVSLLRALPVPVAPMADILEFKRKRRDELKNLWRRLDELYLEISSSGDVSLALEHAKSNLRHAVEDLESVTKESFLI